MARCFCESNILVSENDRHNSAQLLAKIRTVVKLGYSTVILNTVLEEDVIKKKSKQKKKNEAFNLIPQPVDIKLDENEIKIIESTTPNFQILHRLTVVLSEAANTSILTSPAVGIYDILAVQPTSEKVFQTLCQNLEVDIIALELGQRLSFIIRRQQIGVALSHGIMFEITYAPSINDTSVRRLTIGNAQNLVDRCKGKNIILSSAATKVMDLRGPYDVANLGILFGLKEDEAKDAISTNCRSLLIHSKSRRTGRSVMSVNDVKSLPLKDKWKVQACTNGCSSPPSKKKKLK